MRPLVDALVDLDAALGGNAGLMIAGGLGLYLKQEHLRATGARTLMPSHRLPSARTTQDVDLFLHADTIAKPDRARAVRAALDVLDFRPVAGAEFLKFRRGTGAREVTIDLLVGPVGSQRSSIEFKGGRARPVGISGRDALHAYHTPEAVGVDAHWLAVDVRECAAAAQCSVRIPCAFSYVLMKLSALSDRIHDPGKGFGRHHAVDLYRIIAMLSEEDERVSRECALAHSSNEVIEHVRSLAHRLFARRDGLGRTRLREGARGLMTLSEADADLLYSELQRMLS